MSLTAIYRNAVWQGGNHLPSLGKASAREKGASGGMGPRKQTTALASGRGVL